MNAILGMDRLPTGVVPLTSVITRVTYGSEAKAVLHDRHTSLFMDIPLSELADHITEQGNPGNHRGITVAEVQLPAEFLRRGFTFIDTPASIPRASARRLPPIPGRRCHSCPRLTHSFSSPATTARCPRRKPACWPGPGRRNERCSSC